MNMKGQVHFERDIYHSQGIDENNMGQMNSKGMFTKINVPILGIMILFVEVHKCAFIMMQIGLAVWMIANSY
jgi:hypothetical protein